MQPRTPWAILALIPLNLHSAACFSAPAFGGLRQARMVSSPYASKPYPVGATGTPWGASERAEWLAMQKLQRSYEQEVMVKIEALKEGGKWQVEQYGALTVDPERYPLFVLRSPKWDAGKPTCMVTGGVHGYETSGVQGALLFLKHEAEEQKYTQDFNIVVAPCVSPWGYEHIQRWNNNADDPNRNFVAGSSCDECSALLSLVDKLKSDGAKVTVHIDLHETTDTDETEFRPAKAARDGEKYEEDYIPDGFYLVGDSENPQADFHKAIIEEVKKVTHIAPPDAKGQIIGEKPTQEGCIVYPIKSLHLCASVTGAPYVTTTEVYPDSPKATDEICNRAQVASVRGALDYLIANK